VARRGSLERAFGWGMLRRVRGSTLLAFVICASVAAGTADAAWAQPVPPPPPLLETLDPGDDVEAPAAPDPAEAPDSTEAAPPAPVAPPVPLDPSEATPEPTPAPEPVPEPVPLAPIPDPPAPPPRPVPRPDGSTFTSNDNALQMVALQALIGSAACGMTPGMGCCGPLVGTYANVWVGNAVGRRQGAVLWPLVAAYAGYGVGAALGLSAAAAFAFSSSEASVVAPLFLSAGIFGGMAVGQIAAAIVHVNTNPADPVDEGPLNWSFPPFLPKDRVAPAAPPSMPSPPSGPPLLR
jgi:hypothetical protein